MNKLLLIAVSILGSSLMASSFVCFPGVKTFDPQAKMAVEHGFNIHEVDNIENTKSGVLGQYIKINAQDILNGTVTSISKVFKSEDMSEDSLKLFISFSIDANRREFAGYNIYLSQLNKRGEIINKVRTYIQGQSLSVIKLDGKNKVYDLSVGCSFTRKI